MIKNILVALDGSENAEHALDFALDLAEKYSANVLLISVYHHVYYPISVDPTFSQTEFIADLDSQKAYYVKVLSEALKRANKEKPKLKISTKLVEGRPADQIVENAKNENSDIIVMGSRGLGGIKEFLLGSVSDRVADHATCPVLIIK